MDIPKTRQYDTGKVEVIARNSVGEAIATTELNVVARSDDYRGVLKNSPRRKYFKDFKYKEFSAHIIYNTTRSFIFNFKHKTKQIFSHPKIFYFFNSRVS